MWQLTDFAMPFPMGFFYKRQKEWMEYNRIYQRGLRIHFCRWEIICDLARGLTILFWILLELFWQNCKDLSQIKVRKYMERESTWQWVLVLYFFSTSVQMTGSTVRVKTGRSHFFKCKNWELLYKMFIVDKSSCTILNSRTTRANR